MAKPWKSVEKKTDGVRLYAFPEIRSLPLNICVGRRSDDCI